MQFIFDNLVAIIVACVLLLGMQVTQIRSQHAGLEQIASHSVKAKTLVFGQWVERDIMDIGANFGTNLYRFEAPTVDDEGNTSEWVFYSDITQPSGAQARVFKRYRLVETELATFRDTTYQMYQVRRDSAVVTYPAPDVPPTLGSASGKWVENTWSIGTLSFFQVDLLDRQGETPCPTEAEEIKDDDGLVVACTGDIDVYKADYIRVRFGVVPEYVLKPDNYLRELYWVKTLKVRPYWVPPPSLETGA